MPPRGDAKARIWRRGEGATPPVNAPAPTGIPISGISAPIR
ncbi:hypothetical protein L836_3264 [Mycobacteroides abscessus MAB_110811_2726]|nr:hypothetical protein L836_3264 [Mycobacteroides abscessus MAB_110811_2726]